MMFTFEVPFNCLFAPNSRSCMSNIFSGSESLGKSLKDLKTFTKEGCKMRAIKICFWAIFFNYKKTFISILLFSSYKITTSFSYD